MEVNSALSHILSTHQTLRDALSHSVTGKDESDYLHINATAAPVEEGQVAEVGGRRSSSIRGTLSCVGV